MKQCTSTCFPETAGHLTTCTGRGITAVDPDTVMKIYCDVNVCAVMLEYTLITHT